MGPLPLSIPSKRKTGRARREWDGLPTHTWALYSFLFLLKGLRGMGGQLLHGAFWSFLPFLKIKRQGYERVGWVANSYVGPYTSFSTPSQKFERDGWPTPTCGLLLLSNPSKTKQTGLGEGGGGGGGGGGGHFLHGALSSFMSLLKERQTGLGEREREREGWVDNSYMAPSIPF